MIMTARFIVFVFFSALMLLQYQNCATNSEDTFASSNPVDQVQTIDPGKPRLVPYSTVDMDSQFHDHVEIGGDCYPGGRRYNFIDYKLINTDTQVLVSSGKGIYCENGHFQFVLDLRGVPTGNYNVTSSISVSNTTQSTELVVPASKSVNFIFR